MGRILRRKLKRAKKNARKTTESGFQGPLPERMKEGGSAQEKKGQRKNTGFSGNWGHPQ